MAKTKRWKTKAFWRVGNKVNTKKVAHESTKDIYCWTILCFDFAFDSPCNLWISGFGPSRQLVRQPGSLDRQTCRERMDKGTMQGMTRAMCFSYCRSQLLGHLAAWTPHRPRRGLFMLHSRLCSLTLLTTGISTPATLIATDTNYSI